MSLQPSSIFDFGRLDRRVVLKYQSTTRDAMGGEVITWTTAATVWARKLPGGGSRFFAGEGKQYANTIEYVIRHRDDVDTGWRLVHGDDTFEVVSVDPGEGRNRFLTLGLRGVNQSVGTATRSTGGILTGAGDAWVTGAGETIAAGT